MVGYWKWSNFIPSWPSLNKMVESFLQVSVSVFVSEVVILGVASFFRRWFKMLLSEVTKSKIFLDSDDVSKLDAIIDAAGHHFWRVKVTGWWYKKDHIESETFSLVGLNSLLLDQSRGKRKMKSKHHGQRRSVGNMVSQVTTFHACGCKPLLLVVYYVHCGPCIFTS